MAADIYEIFLTVAEAKSYSRASDRLHITPSGISQAVSRLESELGVVLFHRSARGVTLTAEGERLRPHMEKLRDDRLRLEAEVYDIQHHVKGRVRIGTNASICAALLPDILRALRRRCPELEIDLLQSTYDFLKKSLKQERLDLVLCSRSVVDEDIAFEELFRDELLCVTDTSFEADGGRVSLEELKRRNLIVPGQENSVDIERFFQDTGMFLRSSFCVDDDIALLAMIEKGFGVGIMSRLELSCFRREVKTFSLEPPYYRTLGIASRREHTPSLPEREVMQVIRACVAERKDLL